MAKTKVTFKKDSDMWSGITTIYLKIKKKEFGSLKGSFDKWKISIQIVKTDIMEDGNPNCEWKWITFAKIFTSDDEGKKWIQDNIEYIMKKYKVYFQD